VESQKMRIIEMMSNFCPSW